jgi:site-specific recombinase XerD
MHALLVRHKLRERSFHALHDYFLTRLVRGGAYLEAVRELAGHSKLHTTQRTCTPPARIFEKRSGLPGN